MSDTFSNPLITTVIPTYKRPVLLKRAIQSVLNQTYTNVKVCVYDNASGDETREVVEEIIKTDSRVKYHCHEQNLGFAKNFQYGMQNIKGVFFSLLSDDDVLLPDFYNIAYNGFLKYPSAGFVITKTLFIRDNAISASTPAPFPPGFYQGLEAFDAMIKYSPPIWTGILFRKEVIDKIGVCDPEIGILLDWEYELRAASKFDYLFLDEIGAILLLHESSFSGTGATDASATLLYPEGRGKFFRLVKEEYELPEKTAKDAVDILKKRFLYELIRTWCFSIRDHNTQNIIKSAEIVRTYFGLKILSWTMRKAVVLSNFKVIRTFIVYFLKLYQAKKNNNRKKLQKMYGHYSRYLSIK
jgi:glycosyltransferase involved in cell wall biosynthesis